MMLSVRYRCASRYCIRAYEARFVGVIVIDQDSELDLYRTAGASIGLWRNHVKESHTKSTAATAVNMNANARINLSF